MDTAEFSEVTKQKVGYRLREVLSGKKINTRGQNGPGRTYDFDVEKLKRIAKKYGCPLANKLTSLPCLEGVAPSILPRDAETKDTFSEKQPVLQNENPLKETQTPWKPFHSLTRLQTAASKS